MSDTATLEPMFAALESVVPSDTRAPDDAPLAPETQAQWWRRLQQLVADRLQQDHAAAERYRAESAELERDFEEATQRRTETYERERETTQAEYDRVVIEAGTLYADDHASAQSEYSEVLRATERQAEIDVEAAKKKHEEDLWVVQSYFDEEAEGSPKQQFEVFRANIDKLREQLKLEGDELESQKQAADLLMLVRRQGIEVDAPAPDKTLATNDLETVAAQFREASEAVRGHLVELRKLRIPALFAGWRPWVIFLVSWVVLAGITGFLIDPAVLPIETKVEPIEWRVFCGGVMWLPLFITMWILLAISRGQTSPVYEALFERHLVANKSRQRWLKLSDAELKQREEKFLDWKRVITAKRTSATKKADDEVESTLARTEATRLAERRAADLKYPALMEQITKRRDQQLEYAEQDFPGRLNKLKSRFEWDLDKLSKLHDEDAVACSQKFQQAWLAMAEAWMDGMRQLQAGAAESNRMSDEWFRSWRDLGSAPLALPKSVPPALRLGEFKVNLNVVPNAIPAEPQLMPEQTQYALPACLPYPDRPSLLLKVRDEGREAAVAVLQNAMLRLLTTIPGGKVRFTVFDPVGLGDNFAAFMHLVDYDELMITSRIWTEAQQIDQRLADLTEHMENVFQKYLRNEFRSIQEYNEYAGEVAEPYRVLVVANFPANFSEQAARRIVSIAQSGPRCGVFVLASVDLKLRAPLNFDLHDLEENATVFNWVTSQEAARTRLPGLIDAGAGVSTNEDVQLLSQRAAIEPLGFTNANRGSDSPTGEFRAVDPILSELALTFDQPPEPELFTKLVKEAGHASKDARRVEVAFERIAPKDEVMWTGDSSRGLDVPLGRAGATKLQHLKLGKGTSQHVLIAGKTGSGKSTFLHILITNAALHYSPEQLEFYLIDFKKGVEFKTYATHELPHARVIAIESDREFGVSVLERLDGVLKERGDLFRDVGVQDLGSFRAARPKEIMPRILLVVDEFQEFFVEDDKHAQSAALLLDRLVRQGRAFGIHVLLGSQTLGGAYSLARSTLGQMAVRIALQCSESDAHLILSEDNTAARLLTRPGEAIYNDANGMMEGNHPFQIGWLDDDRRDFYLGKVQELTVRRKPHVTPAIIFEGNIPADPRRNSDLATLIQTPIWDGSLPERIAWLGEAVAIKDPTTVSFRPQGGQNVMIVGQNEQGATGLIATGIVSLACQIAPQASDPSSPIPPQFIILDGGMAASDSMPIWRQVAKAIPQSSQVGDGRDVPSVLESLTAELARREQGGLREETPIFLVMFNLGKFRDLRKADDDFGFSFGGSGEKKANPGKLFTDLTKNGPGLGIHTIVWSDTYNNVTRSFSSSSLREFELRIVFQLSQSDSSNIIDTPLAGRLGENRAILHLADQGSNEKFRPYGLPTAEWLEEVGLSLRSGVKSDI